MPTEWCTQLNYFSTELELLLHTQSTAFLGWMTQKLLFILPGFKVLIGGLVTIHAQHLDLLRVIITGFTLYHS